MKVVILIWDMLRKIQDILMIEFISVTLNIAGLIGNYKLSNNLVKQMHISQYHENLIFPIEYRM